MNSDQTGKLWENRFLKILQLEEDSIQFYRDLETFFEHSPGNARIAALLQEVLEDESEHTAICRELLKIVETQRKRKKAAVVNGI